MRVDENRLLNNNTEKKEKRILRPNQNESHGVKERSLWFIKNLLPRQKKEQKSLNFRPTRLVFGYVTKGYKIRFVLFQIFYANVIEFANFLTCLFILLFFLGPTFGKGIMKQWNCPISTPCYPFRRQFDPYSLCDSHRKNYRNARRCSCSD